jgi:hypothetical protein
MAQHNTARSEALGKERVKSAATVAMACHAHRRPGWGSRLSSGGSGRVAGRLGAAAPLAVVMAPGPAKGSCKPWASAARPLQ